MSSQKDILLAKIRERFQSKYKDRSGLSQLLHKELEEISKKTTISKSDLDEIDARLSKSFGPIPGRRNSATINPGARDKSPLVVQSTRNRHHGQPRPSSPDPESISEAAMPQIRSGPRDLKAPVQRKNPNAPGFTDNSMYYFSPMDLQVLHKNRLIDRNKSSTHRRSRSHFVAEESRMLSPMSQEAKSFMRDEDNSQGSIKILAIAPLGNKLPPTYTTVLRERKIEDDMWHKIEQKSMQRRGDLEQEKETKRKDMAIKWAQDLKDQIEQKTINKNQRKNQDIKDSLKHYESEDFMQLEHINRANKHREYINKVSRDNNTANMNSKLNRLRVKNDLKEQESFDSKLWFQLEDEKAENEKRLKLAKRDQLKAIREAEIAENIQKAQRVKNKEQKENEEVLKAWLEKRDHQDATRQKYLDSLKHKAMNQPYYQVPKQEHQLEKGSRGSLELQQGDSDTSLMKFMDAGPHNDAWKRKKRGELQKINELYSQQTLDKAARESAIKKHYGEQQDLWREQEEQFAIREKLTKEAEKLKKLAQKQALDEQIKNDKEIKHSKLTDAERKWNRSIIKDLNKDTLLT